MRHPRSLKNRLLLGLLSAVLLTWGITGYVNYRQTRQEITELFNAELAQSARVVHAFVDNLVRQRAFNKLWQRDALPDLFDTPMLDHKYERKIAFQLRSIKQGMVLRSESAPEFALSLTRNGYSEEQLDDQLWHVFSLSTETGDFVIHVGQRDDIRRELVESITRQQLLGFLLALPVLAGLIGLIVSRSLLPLNQLTAQLAMRQANHLQAIAIDHMPTELRPVVQQLNHLLALLAQALQNERNFSSDASHELRTPLAGLLIQIQVAEKTDDPIARNLALQKAQQAVLRLTQRVQQLLTLSRLHHLTDNNDQHPCDIPALLIQMIAECDAAAHEKTIELVLLGDDVGDWPLNPALCQIMLRNVLENAIHYSPVGSTVQLRFGWDNQALWLCIDDSGPGVDESELPRLTQRFYRGIDSAATIEGSGLGLAIVQRIVALHNGQLQFSRSPLGGLSVRITLPARPSQPMPGSDLRPDMV